MQYTIYDGDPDRCGPCAWPSHEDIDLDARDVLAALAEIEGIARQEARDCGQYEAGDRLWLQVWNDDGVVWGRTITLTVPTPPA